MSDPVDGWNRGPRDEFNGPIGDYDEEDNEGFRNEHGNREGHPGKCARKFMNGMKGSGFAHLVFFIILGLVSIFLVKKCIKKRKDRMRRRHPQLASDPVIPFLF